MPPATSVVNDPDDGDDVMVVARRGVGGQEGEGQIAAESDPGEEDDEADDEPGGAAAVGFLLGEEVGVLAHGAGLVGERSTAGTARSVSSVICQSSAGVALASPATSIVGKVACRVLYCGGDVVVELPREADLVLGAGQLLLQLGDVSRGLEVGVGLGQREQPAERLGQLTFRLRRLRHAGRVHRLVPRRDDRLERGALEVHRALHRVDQVRDQVVPPLELHVDLFPARWPPGS